LELTPALYCNTSIKVLIYQKTILGKTSLITSGHSSQQQDHNPAIYLGTGGENAGAVDCMCWAATQRCWNRSFKLCLEMAVFPGTNSRLSDTTLQKLILGRNSITAMGVAMLLEMMEQNSHHITDLDSDSAKLETGSKSPSQVFGK
jgi:hypothetical protein